MIRTHPVTLSANLDGKGEGELIIGKAINKQMSNEAKWGELCEGDMRMAAALC